MLWSTGIDQGIAYPEMSLKPKIPKRGTGVHEFGNPI